MNTTRTLTVATVFSCCAAGVAAQVGGLSAPPPGSTFATVSIKRHTTSARTTAVRQPPNGDYSIVYGRVTDLVSMAFGFQGEFVGLPDWGTRDRFDVSATSGMTGAPSLAVRRAMMLAMLADRFKLTAHIEARDQPTFDLVPYHEDGSLGPGLTRPVVDCTALPAAQRAAEATRAAGAPPPPNAPLPGTTGPPCVVRFSNRQIEGDVPMAGLASILRQIVGRYVVDQTGLGGIFHVKLEAESQVPVSSSMREQLGLDLRPSHAIVNVLVVDHIEPPVED